MKEAFVEVDSGKLYAQTRHGGAPTLVFLHYWGGSHRTWRPVIDRLSLDCGLVAHDHRGWGRSRFVPGPCTLHQLAEDVQRVIEALTTTEYVLVGHSMGGKVAQLVAARRPSGLTGVVLLAPAPPLPAPIDPATQQARAHAYDTSESVSQAIDVALTKSGLAPELRQQVIEDGLLGSAEARTTWPHEGLVADISDTVRTIHVPVAVLSGDDDRVEPPELLARNLIPYIPTATMTILPGTGHLSPLEAPDEVAHAIDTFVAQVRP